MLIKKLLIPHTRLHDFRLISQYKTNNCLLKIYVTVDWTYHFVSAPVITVK